MRITEMTKIIFLSMLLCCFFGNGTSVAEGAAKIEKVRWAAQPDNSAGEKVWRYVLDFSEPIKVKPQIKGNSIYISGVNQKEQQGKSFGSGSIPLMNVGKSGSDVVLEITPQSGQNLEYKVFALAANSSKGQKERIVVEITNKKTPTAVGNSALTNTRFTQNGYSIQRITVNLNQKAKGTLVLDDSESGVMVVTLKNTGMKVKDQKHTIQDSESVSTVRVAQDGENIDIILPMSTYFRKEDISTSLIEGAGGTTLVQMDIRQKLPDYKYSLTAGVRGKVIAIDPGHGGSDPGAVGPTGIREKNVTLKIALKLGEKLKAAGATVVYTRTTDIDVAKPDASGAEELHKRVEAAHNGKADIFISIHADASVSASAGGTTIYYCSKNKYDGILADAIAGKAIPAGKLYDRGTKEAGFYVIKKSWIPSVLVETAFISNPAEEKLLNQDEFQNRFAQGIYLGIVDYFNEVGGK